MSEELSNRWMNLMEGDGRVLAELLERHLSTLKFGTSGEGCELIDCKNNMEDQPSGLTLSSLTRCEYRWRLTHSVGDGGVCQTAVSEDTKLGDQTIGAFVNSSVNT